MKIRAAVTVALTSTILVTVAAIIVSNDDSDHEKLLRIAYFPNIGHAVPVIGIEKNFFAEEIGPTVTIKTKLFDSGPQVIESLFANSIDVAYVGPGPAINGFLNSEGNNLKILSGAASGGASFIAQPDADISHIPDFAGKKIAAPQIGNTQDVSLRHYLAENGLYSAERGGSVTVYNIPNPDIYTLFVKGEIDGAWVAEPWATILESELGGIRLFHEEDLWPEKQFASVLLIGNTNYAIENPDVIRDLLVAHKDTVKWINQNPEETRNTFNQFLADTLGQPLSDEVVDIALSNLKITSESVEHSIHIFAERADKLGYLGRNGYNLDGIFYNNAGQEENT